jgi:predicted Fe-S protein YdhL (DUF1289 family)
MMSFPAADVASPCVKICVVDPISSLCVGCGRTVAEISLWSEMSQEERRVVLFALDARMAGARSRAARSGRVGRRER